MSELHFASNKAILAACLLSAAGALVFNAFPQVLTAIAVQFELGEAEVGSLISAYMGAFALSALFAPIWMKLLPWKLAAIIGYVVIGVGVVMLEQGGKELVGTAMFVMGLGACVLFTIGVGVISTARDPDRGFGLKLTAEMLLGAVLIFVVAKLVADRFGYSGFVYGTLVLYILTGLGILWLPNKLSLEDDEQVSSQAGGFNWHALLAALAMFIFFGAYAGVWGFVGHVGMEQGISESNISNVLTFALLSGLAGALVCAWLGQSQGHFKPLCIGMLLMVASIVALVTTEGLLSFAIAVCLINALLQFVLAYQMGLLAVIDHSGKYTALIAFILASSAALCGDLMGSLIESRGLTTSMIVSATAVAIALVITILILRRGVAER